MSKNAVLAVGLFLAIHCVCAASASGNPSDAKDEDARSFFDMSIEDLLEQKVTLAAKKPQARKLAPAAIYVVTQEDIRRSGASSIPEALRMAPGINVARMDSSDWAVSARGFNRPFSTKLLVLVDGRTVYSPLFSGVYWDIQDMVLEDVDRIEVIRGPGAALWGANAVNGVINIITKHAKDTQGGLVSITAGDELEAADAVRYGGRVGDAWYRVFAKYIERDENETGFGADADDESRLSHGGFRVDWDVADDDSVTIQGGVYNGKKARAIAQVSFAPPFSMLGISKEKAEGGNILARWNHRFSDENDMILQMYYDRTDRDLDAIHEERDIFDVDFQHSFAVWDRHDVTWGLGYRFTEDSIDNGTFFAFHPARDEVSLTSGFVQDDITLLIERLHLILGSKFEHNEYTEFEIQPSARMIWTPHDQHQIWAAVSRAVRTPNRFDRHAMVTLAVIPPSSALTYLGDDDVNSEDLTAYELGYRVQPSKDVSLDIATFYNRYENLLASRMGTPFAQNTPVPHTVIPLVRDNEEDGYTYGVEMSADWLVFEPWRVKASYSFLEMKMDDEKDNTSSPENQIALLSYLSLPYDIEFDVASYYVDNLSAKDISSYVRTDARIAWRPIDDLELSIIGQNLFDSGHAEFTFEGVPSATEIERSFYAKLTWRF